MQEKRKLRGVNSSESSEDEQFSCHNNDNKVDHLSYPSENEMDRNKRTAWFTSGFQ